jgi:hypothetical protein
MKIIQSLFNKVALCRRAFVLRRVVTIAANYQTIRHLVCCPVLLATETSVKPNDTLVLLQIG